MKIIIATLFPEMCEAVLGESIVGRARKAGKIDVSCRQIREYTQDKHRRVDDTPYGGGMGMVMQCEPIYNCYRAVCEELGCKPHTIYMSPKGKALSQQRAVELSKAENILIICGHYEGVDQRVLDKIVDEEISIGDYVLTGGELPALVLTDTVARLCPGVLSEDVCFEEESIYSGLLEYPHYTRPEVWEGEAVPPVLLSGHHRNIEAWRQEQSLELTKNRRPEMYEEYMRLHPPIEKKKKRR
ncbi:MAG: tRNA (guanosine(37)-N1)-methyltransferase TrmD [Alistipes sp.]|nr:tRNA (guanosine(37)-N1)-methyltransferase TrmD [Alistipes sp.]